MQPSSESHPSLFSLIATWKLAHDHMRHEGMFLENGAQANENSAFLRCETRIVAKSKGKKGTSERLETTSETSHHNIWRLERQSECIVTCRDLLLHHIHCEVLSSFVFLNRFIRRLSAKSHPNC